MPSAFRLPPSARRALHDCLTQFDMVERQRGSNGTFVAEDTGGADPLTMKQAYGPPKKKLPGAVAVAPVGEEVERVPRWRVR